MKKGVAAKGKKRSHTADKRTRRSSSSSSSSSFSLPAIKTANKTVVELLSSTGAKRPNPQLGAVYFMNRLVNNATVSLPAFRALTMAVADHPPSVYFKADGTELKKDAISTSIAKRPSGWTFLVTAVLFPFWVALFNDEATRDIRMQKVVKNALEVSGHGVECVQANIHKKSQDLRAFNMYAILLIAALNGYVFHKREHEWRKLKGAANNEPPDPIPPAKPSAQAYDSSKAYARWIADAFPAAHSVLELAQTVKEARAGLVQLANAAPVHHRLLDRARSGMFNSSYLLRTNGELRDSLDEIGRAYYHFQQGPVARARATVRRNLPTRWR